MDRTNELVEHIRNRPGMYLGPLGEDSPLALLRAVLEPALEDVRDCGVERVVVTLHDDGGVELVTHGRSGLTCLNRPVGGVRRLVERAVEEFPAAGEMSPAAQLVYVRALSERLEVLIDKGGQRKRMSFRSGAVVESLQTVEECVAERPGPGVLLQALTVRFRPDPDIFGAARVTFAGAERTLRRYSYLAPGATFELRANGATSSFVAPDGLADLLRDDCGATDSALTVEPLRLTLAHRTIWPGGMEVSEDYDVALWWTGEQAGVHEYGFVNNQQVAGRHLAGARVGIRRAVNAAGRRLGLVSAGHKLRQEDVCRGLRLAVSATLSEPRFERADRTLLSNDDLVLAAELERALTRWLLAPENATAAVRIVESRVAQPA